MERCFTLFAEKERIAYIFFAENCRGAAVHCLAMNSVMPYKAAQNLIKAPLLIIAADAHRIFQKIRLPFKRGKAFLSA